MSDERLVDYEVGVYHGSLLWVCWKALRTVIGTWWFAKSNGLPTRCWYGVYYKGTEEKVAECGCLPMAEEHAQLFVKSLREARLQG